MHQEPTAFSIDWARKIFQQVLMELRLMYVLTIISATVFQHQYPPAFQRRRAPLATKCGWCQTGGNTECSSKTAQESILMYTKGLMHHRSEYSCIALNNGLV
uniref:Uncharacterized protein n=1 Tax=Tanacetum cinerariifolium TaxID=118510 RepID=A0A6L2KG53_TANCI|nr:hypothetical protein [Tanacetum cinerariifolium]